MVAPARKIDPAEFLTEEHLPSVSDFEYLGGGETEYGLRVFSKKERRKRAIKLLKLLLRFIKEAIAFRDGTNPHLLKESAERMRGDLEGIDKLLKHRPVYVKYGLVKKVQLVIGFCWSFIVSYERGMREREKLEEFSFRFAHYRKNIQDNLFNHKRLGEGLVPLFRRMVKILKPRVIVKKAA